MERTVESELAPRVLGIDHFGIRVSNRQLAVDFYQRLGFQQTLLLEAFEANEMVNDSGLRINLIFNGARQSGRKNLLLDEPIKYPGFTHPAFIVANLTEFRSWCHKQGIEITEDIHPIGNRRIALFIRDPDGNVLEFNQLLDAQITTRG